MRATNEEFKDGVLIRSEGVDVPDPEPTPEELAAARLAALEARFTAIKDALAESSDPKVAAVATRIAEKEAATKDGAAIEPGAPVRGRP